VWQAGEGGMRREMRAWFRWRSSLGKHLLEDVSIDGIILNWMLKM
jgi:hypothetical protein